MNKDTFTLEDSVAIEERQKASIFSLARYGRSHLKYFLLGFALLFCSTVLAMSSARCLGLLVDEGLSNREHDVALMYGGLVTLLEFFALLFAYFGRRTIAKAALGSILSVRKRLFQHLEKLPMQYFDRTPQGRTVTRLTHDVESLEEFFSSSLGKLLSSLVMAIGALTAMLLTHFWMGLLVTLSVLPAIALTLAGRNMSRNYNREISRRNSSINSMLSEFLSGIPVIRVFGLENWSLAKFDARVSSYLESNILLNRIYSWLRPLIGFLSTLPLILIIGVGGYVALAGTIGVGVIVSFVRYYERFGRPLVELSLEIQVIQLALASAERIAVFLDSFEEDYELGKNGSLTPTRLCGEIEFKRVTMQYGVGAPALSSVSFHVLPGQVVGLTGSTGSGKSTTVSLLARLYEFQEGDILIDGQSIRSYNRESLRSGLGFVSQDVMIMKGTVRVNLSIDTTQDDELIIRTAKSTGFLSVMERNQLTLDSELLEHGANLSVGEKQLLAFTRILLRNPSILVLDEATANIDEESEARVQDALNLVMKGRTTLIIAHRLHTLETCDTILVFQHGKVIEKGTHAELLVHRGAYAKLWSKSSRELALSSSL